jgi:excinuclease UvrABC nuclease subunit
MDQAGKSFGLLKKVSSLESQMSNLMAKIVQLEECDAFLTEIIESACEQLQCKLLGAPRVSSVATFGLIDLDLMFPRYLLGPCCQKLLSF